MANISLCTSIHTTSSSGHLRNPLSIGQANSSNLSQAMTLLNALPSISNIFQHHRDDIIEHESNNVCSRRHTRSCPAMHHTHTAPHAPIGRQANYQRLPKARKKQQGSLNTFPWWDPIAGAGVHSGLGRTPCYYKQAGRQHTTLLFVHLSKDGLCTGKCIQMHLKCISVENKCI